MSAFTGTVLLTGANGFVASHILRGLVERNYHIVATVRSPAKAEELIKLHPTWKSNITFSYVTNITAPGAYDPVFENHAFDYIINNASPLNFSATEIEKEVIDPAVQGTKGLIASAHKGGGPSLKRFVQLGSSVAIQDEFEDTSKPGKPYTEADWNPVTAEYAIENKNAVAGYNVSKKLSERAVWNFMEENKPAFDLVVINPDIIIGPMLQHVPGPRNVNETNTFAVYNFLNGTYTDIDKVKFPFYHFVDVRDVALAHILAMTTPDAGGKRVILVSGSISPQLVVNAIRKNFPELRDRIVEGHPEQEQPPGLNPTGWDTRRSLELFGSQGFGYKALEDSVVDTVRSLLELEKGWK
ncbi:NAD(P)-binding protein [Massarina eburnea CBS 473.64]|uniref:NAD(P)-binding protein n=1 Tax=Massarina eburnea CBS 473.64 TaxID=1395130 RepID=A0A6A6RPD0_9PLEO|nr:NAD(P)-binding protein [Massarina eburnea CBS 473.64]